MIKIEHDTRLMAALQYKRRINIALFVSMTIVLLLSVAIVILSGKRERTVIIPNTLSEEIWLETTQVSPSYIRQIGDYFLKLALIVTPDTAESQYAFILKNVYPSNYGEIKTELIKRMEQIKRKSLSTVFNPRHYEVDVKNLSVLITGGLELSSGAQKLDIEDRTYKVSFIYDNGRLYIKEIIEVKS